jgi:hypothetical protein
MELIAEDRRSETGSALQIRTITRRVLQRRCHRGHSHLLLQECRLCGNPHISGQLVLVLLGVQILHNSNLSRKVQLQFEGATNWKTFFTR